MGFGAEYVGSLAKAQEKVTGIPIRSESIRDAAE
jgi:hypothetical protein